MSEPMTMALVPPTGLHDLPPKWDGRPVEWKGWVDEPLGCPEPGRPSNVCTACGSSKPTIWNGGKVHPLPGEQFTAPKVRRTRSGREYVRGEEAVARAAWPVIALVVFRCRQCRHDVVWDERTGEWWDLDPSDYGDAGSN